MLKGKNLLIILVVLGVVSWVILKAITGTNSVEKANQEAAPVVSNAPSQEEDVEYEVLSVKDLYHSTEVEIKNEFGSMFENYTERHLVPSKKVAITGFDLDQANVQIDYNVATNKPVYIGYSFSENPLAADRAWQITGTERPKATPEGNPGIKNRKVEYWQNIPEISPFKMVQIITEADGKVSKIAFSIEDLATAQGSRSLYYIPN